MGSRLLRAGVLAAAALVFAAGLVIDPAGLVGLLRYCAAGYCGTPSPAILLWLGGAAAATAVLVVLARRRRGAKPIPAGSKRPPRAARPAAARPARVHRAAGRTPPRRKRA